MKPIKKTAGILLLIFISIIKTIIAQEPVPMLLKNGRYSFVKFGTKDIVIPNQFDDARPFKNGYAFVKEKGKWGAINNSGEIVLQPIYEKIAEISGGYYKAQFTNGSSLDYFDKNFNELEKTSFITEFSNGYAILSMNTKKYYNKAIIVDTAFNIIKTFYNNRIEIGKFNSGYFRYGLNYLGLNAELLFEEINYSEIGDFEDGFAKVKRGDKYGYINISGDEVIPLRYDELGPFREGLAFARIGSGAGYINKKGEFIIPLQAEFEGGNFSEGLAFCKKNNNFFYINQKAEFFPLASVSKNKNNFSHIYKENFNWYEFANGVALFEDDDIRYINKKFEFATNHSFFRASKFKNGFAIVYDESKTDNNMFGIINTEGKLVLPTKYEYIYYGSSRFFNHDDNSFIDNTYSTLVEKHDPYIRSLSITTESSLLKNHIKDFFINNVVLVEELGQLYYVDINGFEYKE